VTNRALADPQASREALLKGVPTASRPEVTAVTSEDVAMMARETVISRDKQRFPSKGRTWRELKQLLRLPGFRKLFLVRLVSQTADGMFQVGLATLLFFSPESMGTAAGVAAGFAVMLAPFTLVGPFAGVLLDRWSRRQILLFGNLLRALITTGMAIAFALRGEFALVNILGLAALSINRFLLAGLSAGLPKIIADDCPPDIKDPKSLLLTANSLVPTIGAGAAFLGGAIGFLLSVLLGHEALVTDIAGLDSSITLFAAAIMMILGELAAARLSITQLGPETKPTETFRQGLARVVTDLTSAARYLKQRVTPAQALGATAIHRFLYGLVFIAAILMARNVLVWESAPTYAPAVENYASDGGLGQFAVIMGLIGVGGAIAVVLTPLLSRSIGPQRWVGLMFLVAAGSMLVLSIAPTLLLVFTAALILGIGSQGSKIAVDTIVQRDTEDQYRGRAFAFYDVLFNAAFVAAAALAAFIVPDQGWSRPLFYGIAACYLITGLWMYFRAATGARTIPLVPQ